jgi:hypothetical protein
MLNILLKLLKITKFEGELSLKDGTILIIEGGTLGIGAKVSINGPDGTIPLPAGSYELESGDIITVDDKGIITNITQQIEQPETPDTEVVETPEDVIVEDEVNPETGTTTETAPEIDFEAKFKDLEDRLKTLEEKTQKLSEQNEKFESDLEIINNKTNFTKELPKNSTPDVVIPTSPAVERLNAFRKIAGKK